MEIKYADALYAWEDFRELVQGMVEKTKVSDVAEIGAGANPMLTPAFMQELGKTYHLIDESREELVKAGPGYTTHVWDVQTPMLLQQQQFDLVIARMTLEHIRHPEPFFLNIRQLLKPGGKACLFFATVTNLPMFANSLLPERVSEKLLLFFQPFRKNEKHGKFRAWYRWCYGPTRKNISRFEKSGFNVERYTGFFGHTYYKRIPPLHFLEQKKTAFLLRHPSPFFCTYGQVVLSREEA